MSNFDYDKIKDMEYDPNRQCYVGKDGSEFHVTPYSNGQGYKYDYYDKSPYGNASHNSTHVKSDLNENWTRVDNDREKGTQEKSSGSGCYLTTACISHMQENFDDDCDELMTLRWFRDNFVNKEDITHYYDVAPTLVDIINLIPNKDEIYTWVYEYIVQPCVKAIKQKNYEFAYNRYKTGMLLLEDQFLPKENDTRVLRKIIEAE